VPSAASEGEVSVRLAGTEFVTAVTRGLTEVPAATPDRFAPVWRSYRYANGPAHLQLVYRLSSGNEADPVAAKPIFGQAVLVTRIEPNRLLHRLQFDFWNWSQ